MTKIVSLLACIALLVGCSTPISKVDKSKNAMEGIKSITLIAPREPWSYTVMNFADPGFVFKTMDIEVKVSESQKQQVQLTDMLKRHSFSFSAELSTRIAENLRRSGYQVTLQDGPWVQVNQGYSLKYADIQSNTDAVLVIAPTVLGFVSPRDAKAYAPTITTVVTLLNKDKTRKLYQGYLATGWKPLDAGWDYAHTTQTFPTFDDVLSEPSKTLAALKEASASIANLATRNISY
jgi:hypothetical protein